MLFRSTDVLDRIIWNNNNFTEASAGPIAAASADSDGPMPQFIYDAATGIMTVQTNGHFLTDIVIPGPGDPDPVDGEGNTLPRTDDLFPKTLLPGHDAPGGVSFNSRSGVNIWNNKYFLGKFQAYDNNLQGTDGEFELSLWFTGLSEGDFGVVEWSSVPVPGETGVGGEGVVTVVPEPATMALLGLGGMIIMARRRRRK